MVSRQLQCPDSVLLHVQRATRVIPRGKACSKPFPKLSLTEKTCIQVTEGYTVWFVAWETKTQWLKTTVYSSFCSWCPAHASAVWPLGLGSAGWCMWSELGSLHMPSLWNSWSRGASAEMFHLFCVVCHPPTGWARLVHMVAAGVQESRSRKVSGGPSLEYTYIISTTVYWQPRFKGWENRLHFSIGGAVKNYGHFCNYHKNSEEDAIQENVPVHYTRPEYLVMLN